MIYYIIFNLSLSFSPRLLRPSAIMVWHFVVKQYGLPGNKQLSSSSKRSRCQEHRWLFYRAFGTRALKGRSRYVRGSKLKTWLISSSNDSKERVLPLGQQSPGLQSIYSKRIQYLLQVHGASSTQATHHQSSLTHSMPLFLIFLLILCFGFILYYYDSFLN